MGSYFGGIFTVVCLQGLAYLAYCLYRKGTFLRSQYEVVQGNEDETSSPIILPEEEKKDENKDDEEKED